MRDMNPVPFESLMVDAPLEMTAMNTDLLNQDKKIKKRIVSLSNYNCDWIKNKLPARKALLTDSKGSLIIPRGKVGMIIGAGGTGKTRLLLQLCFCLSAKIPFQGSLLPQDNEGKILYFFGEEDIEEIQRRLQEMYHTLRLTDDQLQKVLGNIDVVPLQGFTANFLKEDVSDSEQIESQIQEFLRDQAKSDVRYSLIVLDPISRFIPEEGEIDNIKATQFISMCERFASTDFGSPTILLSHHVNKDSIGGVLLFSEEEDKNQGSSRGATGLVDGCRFVLSIDTVKKEAWMENSDFSGSKIIKMRHVKANYGPYMKPILSYFDETGVIVPLSDKDLDDLKQCKNSSTSKNQKTHRDKCFEKKLNHSRNFAGPSSDFQ